MAITVPLVVAGVDAPNSEQHLVTDINDSFGRLIADANSALTDLTDAIADINDALALLAPLASPAFTGTPTAPSASGSTDTTQIATTAFTQDALDARAATQAELEAGSVTTTFTTPGRQQFHPSAAKVWGYVVISAGTPGILISHNVTSVTDVGVGVLGVTIATDFSSDTYAVQAEASNLDPTTDPTFDRVWNHNMAAGSFQITASDGATDIDPLVWSFAAFGDQ